MLIRRHHVVKLPAQSRSITNTGLEQWWICSAALFKNSDSMAAVGIFDSTAIMFQLRFFFYHPIWMLQATAPSFSHSVQLKRFWLHNLCNCHLDLWDTAGSCLNLSSAGCTNLFIIVVPINRKIFCWDHKLLRSKNAFSINCHNDKARSLFSAVFVLSSYFRVWGGAIVHSRNELAYT